MRQYSSSICGDIIITLPAPLSPIVVTFAFAKRTLIQPVEQGVQLVQRWIVAALRQRQFFSLAQTNEAISELLAKLNQRPFRMLPGTRMELYQQLDRTALQPLPLRPYEFAEWKKDRV